MKKIIFLFFVIPILINAQNLNLKGIFSLSVPSGGSDGKAIHLKASSNISDLSLYGIGVSQNGEGSDGLEYNFDSVQVNSGDDILVVRDLSAFTNYFLNCIEEFEFIFIDNNNLITQNGNDGVELYFENTIIDTFGDVNVDGLGLDWEYTDSWAFFNGDNWIYGGVNCTNNSTTIFNSECLYPICQIIYGCIDENASNYDPNANTDDGSCNYEIIGCTNSVAINYNPDAAEDDGSCIFENEIILQGIISFILPTGEQDGKAIHLKVVSEVSEISNYSIGIANNGGGTDGPEFDLPSDISVNIGDDILIVRNTDAISSYFSDCFSQFEVIILGNNTISQNGNDAIELYYDNLVIETYGDIFTNGTGQAWEYTGSWAYKNGNEWETGGIDCTSGYNNIFETSCVYPSCELLCNDENACNFGEYEICTYPNEIYLDCNGDCLNDENNDGVCDELEIIGCTDELGCNYNSDALFDDGSCVYPYDIFGFSYLDCDGNCLNDDDSDGVCDDVEINLKGVLSITLIDGEVSDGKAIHLKAISDVTNLSLFGIGIANNGGGSDGQEFTFEQVQISAGDDILVVRNQLAMSNYFEDCYDEFEHIFIDENAVINQNGDDAIELYFNNNIIESLGDANIDGTNQDWEYTGSWAYKNESTWSFGDLNCSSGSTTFESNCPYPLCLNSSSVYFEQRNSFLFPNPSSNFIDLYSNEDILEVIFYDINGKNIKTISRNFKNIDISSFKKGTYFVKIIFKEKTTISKLIKK